ncbi:FAD-linked oxidase-like protein [Panaeolus papilionaceus]|nr:FAD-linked oxidase-like protein [Panaeolus papilionaceus]
MVQQIGPPSYGSYGDFQRAMTELQSIFAEDSISTDPEELHFHGFSAHDYHPRIPPSVVVYPACTADVVKIVKIATKYRMPVIAFSGGTSLEGHFRAHTLGGICIDMNKMDRILEIHEKDSDLVCEPAARWVDINEHLRKKGIIDPGPGATIGGMLSTGCSGTNAVRYGTAKGEWFLNATVVLPSGEVIKTRRRARKSAAGFDLTKLFIGAEGTLGIITEVTIRLAPVQSTNVAVVHFPDVMSATEASIDILNQGVGIQCVELLDEMSMKAINNYGMSIRKWPDKISLFLKLQGVSNGSLAETAKIVEEVTKKHGGTGFSLARDEKEAHDLWADRKNIYFAGLSLVEGSRGLTTDVCVPISNLPALIAETKKDLENIGIVSSVVGHVGDGNFHALLLFTNDEELKVAKAASHRIVMRAIVLDGTCTGEHGVGMGKKEYLTEELGEGTVELMKAIKRTIDPHNLFNPGKLYPDDHTPTKKS